MAYCEWSFIQGHFYLQTPHNKLGLSNLHVHVHSLAFLQEPENECGNLHLQNVINQVMATANITDIDNEGSIVEWFKTYSYNQVISTAKFSHGGSKGGLVKLIKT